MTRDNGERNAVEIVVRASARSTEPDRYLAALLAPRFLCADLIAVAAFVGEISRIPLTVNEPMMGEVRLQWWSDAFVNLRNDIETGNPIADAIGAAIRTHKLPEALFLNMIEARLSDLDPHPLLSDAGVDTYFDDTEGGAFQLAAQVLGVNREPGVSELMAVAGQAYGRVRLLRSLPRAFAKRRVSAMPEGASFTPDGDWQGSAAAMRNSVIRWLAAARRLSRTAPKAVLPAILPLALVEPYLAALEGYGPNLVRQPADILPLTRVWRLWWARAVGRI